MRFKKKTAVILSFALGTVLFTTTAIAGVIAKSGYDQLKDSVKYTAESCTSKLSNYTMDVAFVVKDNGNIVFSESSLNKVDTAKQATESVSTKVEGTRKTEDYSYTDKNQRISKNNDENMYYVTEYAKARENTDFKNPFKEKEATDVERILDALVGNLKDAVVVTENADGGKTLSGSISESQIPALINAVVSFQGKTAFGSESNNGDVIMPKITKDIYVKEVKGNMVINKDGLIQNVLGSGVISGKEENGKEHNLTFEVLAKMTDINSTKVAKPDLAGKKVEKNVEQDYSKLSNPQKYIGKYKTDILIEKDGKFEKIGEKFIDVTAINETSMSGRFYEQYAKGYESYAKNNKDFKFDVKFDKDNLGGEFTAVGASNTSIKGNVSIQGHNAKIYFNINENTRGNTISNDEYSRVFN